MHCKDSQAIDLGLALTLLSNDSEFDEFVQSCLSEIIDKCIFSFESNGVYQIVNISYEKLLEHKNKRNVDGSYKNKVTGVSVFSSLYKLVSVSQKLGKFSTYELEHSTLQYWYPNQHSEQFMYSNSDIHGSASTNFPMNGGLALEHIKQECSNAGSFKRLSTITSGKEPLVLSACRCYRYPVLFHYLEDWLTASEQIGKSDISSPFTRSSAGLTCAARVKILALSAFFWWFLRHIRGA